jgi:hypothetical protein
VKDWGPQKSAHEFFDIILHFRICVCCHRVSRRVSDYIRYAERHRDVGQPKATYINQICDELRGRAANELGLAESGRISRVERRSKKRAREGGYIDSRTSGAQKARLHAVDMTIMNELGFQLANGIDPLQIPSLDSHQTRYTSSSPFHAVGHSTYASLKCCRARSHRRLSRHVNRGILPRVYRRTNRSSGRHCYGPVLDRNGRHSTRPLTDTYMDTDPALV